MKKWTNERVQQLVQERGKHITCLTDLSTVQQPSVTKVEWQCNDCGWIWQATVDSIHHSNSGCPKCAGNLAFTTETLNLRLKADGRDDLVCLDISPGKRRGNAIIHRRGSFRCLKCGKTWTANLHNINKWHYGCPYCNANIGKRVYDKDYGAFHSQFEYNCFILLKTRFPNLAIERQVRYCKARRFTCDFVLRDFNIWIECCGAIMFKDKNYETRLRDKVAIAKDHNYKLCIVRNIPEMNHLLKELEHEIGR